MRTERGTVEGDVAIRDDLTLHGMITGTATVEVGASLRLCGTVCGDLVIEAGAEAQIDGTVGGTVVNHGTATIDGTVGDVRSATSATTTISDDAVVRAQRRES